MTATMSIPAPGTGAAYAKTDLDSSVEGCVQRILVNKRPQIVRAEQRLDVRHPYPYPICMRSVDSDGVTPVGEGITVVGKHLAHGGLDFYHLEPLPDRRMVATFDLGTEQAACLLLELTWCRYGGHGLYENGGRFLHRVALP